ncbi:membrane associated DnaJ chaperone-like protein [Rhizodiscina lignyota]|uniref:Membrane associated DnaJ chaperone-like protein n=1 Tax=Rhizodiscina lignyota TaxID=1504668 RepID=A0A9P4I7H8_9PEZI|nr:membrane associated DnaJ chaperone-like protein [Rhizodiscina lignyota]
MSQVLSYAGWYFLPNLVSGWVQTTLYGIFIRAGEPKPQPGSPKWIKHRRIIQICVILLYLLYNIYEADWQIQREGNFYRDLGVSYDAEEKRIRSRTRRLLASYHPDKASNDNPLAEAFFIHLRQASDVLVDPAKRFAYDRFGPTMMDWKHCITIKDYLTAGATQIIPYYIGSTFFMALLNYLGYMESGKYWRFLTVACLFVFEAFSVTRTTWPGILTNAINPIFETLRVRPPYLPFEAISLARKLSITFFIALAQVTPLLKSGLQSGNEAVRLQQQLDRLDSLAKHNDQEVGRLLGLELTPFAGDEAAEKDVRSQLQNWLVQNTIRATPEVRDAIGRVLQRRREGAPTGARGTR